MTEPLREPEGEDGPGPSGFHTSEQFFEGFLKHVYARDPDNSAVIWCPRWFEHPEALYVVEELWRSWETQRMVPGVGEAIWLVNFFYPLMTKLTDATGGFHGCSAKKGHTPQCVPLPGRSWVKPAR